ncbi:MAG TPA: endonuclease domain-containing protein [Thermoanaerobaculia bacterium]|nr:endonuclease domain-containing protein [Thermoanaerobaculia bacterium]
MSYRGGESKVRYRPLCRAMRKRQTGAESIFWKMCRNRRLFGLKFRRQHQIGSCIVDFYCPELRLAIEFDGDRHYTSDGREADLVRDYELELSGITVVRCRNREFLDRPSVVLGKIERMALRKRDRDRITAG